VVERFINAWTDAGIRYYLTREEVAAFLAALREETQ
jgi:hypothetical protein